MEKQKTLDLLNEANDSKFMTRKSNIVNNQSNTNYDVWHVIIYNAEVLKSNLCDYKDAQNLVRGDITIIVHQIDQIAFKNYAPFTMCITKIDETTIDDAEDLDLVIPMYNLIEYSSKKQQEISVTAVNLWFCSKDEANNADIANNSNFKSFK